MPKRSLAAVGDVADPHCWSGIPFHFWQSARKAGFASDPWHVDLRRVTWQRPLWNFGQALCGGTGGFQYSKWFLDLIERQIPPDHWQNEVITFNQHFPRAHSVTAKGGRLSHYLDAPFAAIASGRGLDLRLPPRVVERAKALERDNYAASQRVVVMARWAADVVRSECGVPEAKVQVVLPGANLVLPSDWECPTPVGRAGRERNFTLGFVGKDWQRKGLPLLLSVRDELSHRGWRVRVLAAGNAPAELLASPQLEFVGYLDKHRDPESFLRFVSACDVGCLFSDREALGISTLEFLRAGIPVAGFAHEGPADTLPPDAGFRFERGSSAETIADTLEAYLKDEDWQATFRNHARRWSSLVTWERCVAEMQELWATSTVARPVQLWRGLPSSPEPASLTP